MLKKSFKTVLCGLWALGVIATADISAVPPTRCNDAVSDHKPISCIYMPIIILQPEDEIPPIDPLVSRS